MKKTFKLIGLVLLAAGLVLAGCNPEDDPITVDDEIVDDQNPSEDPDNPGEDPGTSSSTFDFDGVVNWAPQSIHGLYVLEGTTPYVVFVATRDQTSINDVFDYMNGQGFDGGDVREGWLIGRFSGIMGSQTTDGCLFLEEAEDGLMLFTGTTTIYEEEVPAGWASVNLSINVTAIDITANTVSATIIATMQDILYIISHGMGGDNTEKTFTINLDNISLVDISDYKGLANKIKTIKRK